MRTITITRRKSFVACFAKMKVYIEDHMTPELTIADTPCRFLGTLKNGETVTFPIPTTTAKLFVIADKASRGYSSELLPIPEGEENIYVSGQCQYNTMQGNPFRFDGITGEATVAHRNQARKKSVAVYIAAIAIGLVIGLFLAFFDVIFPPKPETYTKEEFSITLTNRFDEYSEDGYLVCYESGDVAVLVEKFLTSEVDYNTAEELANAMATSDPEEYPILKNVTKESGLVYYDYEYEDLFDHFAYGAYYFVDGGYFYVVTFGCEYSDYDNLRDDMAEWAESISFN